MLNGRNLDALNCETQFERFGGGSAQLIPLRAAQISKADIEIITSICNSSVVKKWVTFQYATGPNGQYTMQDAADFVRLSDSNWSKQQSFTYIIRDERQIIVGTIGIQSIAEDAPIGYWTNTDGEHSGYMTNAVKALCLLAKSAGYKSLYAFVDTNNDRSAKVLQRADFILEGMEINPKIAVLMNKYRLAI